jgi:Ice-binding-like
MKRYLKFAFTSGALLCCVLALILATRSYAQDTITKPLLGTAGSFAVLGGSTVTNTGPTVVNGNLGVSPGSAITGFPPGTVHGVMHKADAVALQAQKDVTTAYNSAAGAPCSHDMTGVDLGNKSLVAGVYCFSSSAQLTGHLTLKGTGVFIFQVGSTLTTGSNASVSLLRGASPCNVFWQVGSSATVGTDTDFVGNILALTSITAKHGARFNGGLYARSGAVTLDTNTISRSSCGGGSTPTPKVSPTSTPKFPSLPNTGSDPNP